MAEAVRQAALVGDQVAREMEENRIHGETRTIDMRDTDKRDGSRCYRAEVHEPHDHDEEVWCEPRWVNPRTIWKHHCIGVKDETPYERIAESGKTWGVSVHKQDEVAPPGEFRMCRGLRASGAHSGDLVNLAVTVWKSVPREWPPRHIGDSTAGMNLTREEAILLRDWLTAQIDESAPEEG